MNIFAFTTQKNMFWNFFDEFFYYNFLLFRKNINYAKRKKLKYASTFSDYETCVQLCFRIIPVKRSVDTYIFGSFTYTGIVRVQNH